MFLDSQKVTEGWYPDPSGRLLLRFWDGHAWTPDTRGNDSWAAPAAGGDAGPHLTPPPSGWAGVAFALHSALMSGTPTTVTISLPSHEQVTIDTHHHVYHWHDEPAELPELPAAPAIVFSPGSTEANRGARSLDGLLWRISKIAFPHGLAPWLQDDDLYRMQRWPNLTTINPELDDMRQAAMLANGMFTVDELAGFSDREVAATRSLVNALSLMNTLKVATPRATTVFVPAPGSFGVANPSLVEQQVSTQTPARALPQNPNKPGLFQRLRNRLGL